jgi:hypothetical protein
MERAAWRKPSAVIAAGGLMLSLTGALVSWQREHERDQDLRLQRLEQGRAVTDQQTADGQQAILIRLDALHEALNRLREDLHRENDTVLRRLETVERRGK